MEKYYIGDVVRYLRKENKMTQEELADGICSPVTISRIENGSQMPSDRIINQILERLGSDVYQTTNIIRNKKVSPSSQNLSAVADLIQNGNITLASEQLSQINSTGFDNKQQQYLILLQVSVILQSGSSYLSLVPDKIIDALKLTKSNFSPDDFDDALLTIREANLLSLIPKLFTKKLAQLQKDSAVNNSKYTNKIKEIFYGYATIKNYSLEYQFNDFQKSNLLTSEGAKRQVNIEMSKLYALANIASILTQFSIMLFAGFLVVRGELTLGSIVAVTQLSGQVISPAFQLSAKIGLIKSVKPIIAQITEILAESSDILPLPDKKQTSIHDIEFKKVSFSYDERPILRDVSFHFEKGKKYALIGESGSGKSTILKLLMQYYDNYSGNILIDHQSLNNYSSFFEECAYVSQDTFLFEDSVKNNLCLYKNISENRLNDVLEKTGLISVIQKLPDGINTILSENGNNLSGGERQRMAIARALLHNKKILLFDEATSALDAALAEKIEDLILSLENTTCIFVSHKLSQTSYDQFDAILNLSDGQLSKAIA